MKKIILLVVASLMFTGVASAASVWGIYKGNSVIRLTVEGVPVKVSDMPAIVYQGRTVIPVYLLRQAGIDYTWDNKSKTVDIKKLRSDLQNNFDAAEATKEVVKYGGDGVTLESEDGVTTAVVKFVGGRGLDLDMMDMKSILLLIRGFNTERLKVLYLDEDGNNIGSVMATDDLMDDHYSGKMTEKEFTNKLIFTGRIGQKPLTVKEIARLRDRVAYIETYDESGKTLSTASGFILEGGILITNYHVIEGSTGLRAKVDGQLYDNVEVYYFENRTSDLFGLYLSTSYNDKGQATGSMPTKYLDLERRMPEVGEKVYAIGSPYGLENTVTEGIVSGVRTIDGITYIQHTATIEPGSSGGVLLNEYGNVIGVNTWKAGNANLYFSVPSEYVYQELKKAK